MAIKRKVCLTGPSRLTVAEELLRAAGCDLVLGKPADNFPDFHYARKELVSLIGNCEIVFPVGRDFISGDVLDSCPDVQAVVKSSIGIETVDVNGRGTARTLTGQAPRYLFHSGLTKIHVRRESDMQ